MKEKHELKHLFATLAISIGFSYFIGAFVGGPSFDQEEINEYLSHRCDDTKYLSSKIEFNDDRCVNANRWLCDYIPIENFEFIPDNSGIEIYASDVIGDEQGEMKCQVVIFAEKPFLSTQYKIKIYCVENHEYNEFF